MREKILAVIEKNSRIDIHDLAILLGENEVAVANEIAEMEKERIICGYHTLINWDNTSEEKVSALIEDRDAVITIVGYPKDVEEVYFGEGGILKNAPTGAYVIDMTTSSPKLAERIYQYSEVNALYLMAGGFDFMVIIEGKTMRQVAQFVSDKLAPLDSVLSTATHFVLKKYKDHGTVLSEEIQDERMLITP
jgi:DNA-binding Lrp family transcriptional regulator